MEFELKYGIDSIETFKSLWDDVDLKAVEVEDTRKELSMITYYLDTEDYRLMDKKIAIRIRDDGTKIIATLKTLVKAEGHIHKREEIEKTLLEFPKKFDVDLFDYEKLDLNLEEIVGNRSLGVILETEIRRSLFLVKFRACIVEVALDQGVVRANEKESAINEMELELVSGPENDLLSLGESIVGKYKLKPEPKSKFERGLQLLGKC